MVDGRIGYHFVVRNVSNIEAIGGIHEAQGLYH